jgi:hypothetical protein
MRTYVIVHEGEILDFDGAKEVKVWLKKIWGDYYDHTMPSKTMTCLRSLSKDGHIRYRIVGKAPAPPQEIFDQKLSKLRDKLLRDLGSDSVVTKAHDEIMRKMQKTLLLRLGFEHATFQHGTLEVKRGSPVYDIMQEQTEELCRRLLAELDLDAILRKALSGDLRKKLADAARDWVKAVIDRKLGEVLSGMLQDEMDHAIDDVVAPEVRAQCEGLVEALMRISSVNERGW